MLYTGNQYQSWDVSLDWRVEANTVTFTTARTRTLLKNARQICPCQLTGGRLAAHLVPYS